MPATMTATMAALAKASAPASKLSMSKLLSAAHLAPVYRRAAAARAVPTHVTARLNPNIQYVPQASNPLAIRPGGVVIPGRSIMVPDGVDVGIAMENAQAAQAAGTPNISSIVDVARVVGANMGPPQVGAGFTRANCPKGSIAVTVDGKVSCRDMSGVMTLPKIVGTFPSQAEQAATIPPEWVQPGPTPNGQGVVCNDGSIASTGAQCPGVGGPASSLSQVLSDNPVAVGAGVVAVISLAYFMTRK